LFKKGIKRRKTEEKGRGAHSCEVELLVTRGGRRQSPSKVEYGQKFYLRGVDSLST